MFQRYVFDQLGNRADPIDSAAQVTITVMNQVLRIFTSGGSWRTLPVGLHW